MNKFKKILAWVAIGCIALFALLTLVFALIYNFTGSEFSQAAWKASAWAMVVVPAFIYIMLLIYRVLDKRDK